MRTAPLIVAPQGLVIRTNELTINGYVIRSDTGVFTGRPARNLGVFREDEDGRISGAMGYELDGTHRLGKVVGEEYWKVDFSKDLDFTFTVADQAGTYRGAVVLGFSGGVQSTDAYLSLPAASEQFVWDADDLLWLAAELEQPGHTEHSSDEAVDLLMADGWS